MSTKTNIADVGNKYIYQVKFEANYKKNADYTESLLSAVFVLFKLCLIIAEKRAYSERCNANNEAKLLSSSLCEVWGLYVLGGPQLITLPGYQQIRAFSIPVIPVMQS